MYSHTKKVGSLGRYGPRVGRKVRHEARKIEDLLKKPKKCPQCGKPKVRRKAAGIWECKSCGTVFAGGAYTPMAFKKEAKSFEETAVERPDGLKKVVQEKREAQQAKALESVVEEVKPKKEAKKTTKSKKKKKE